MSAGALHIMMIGVNALHIFLLYLWFLTRLIQSLHYEITQNFVQTWKNLLLSAT